MVCLLAIVGFLIIAAVLILVMVQKAQHINVFDNWIPGPGLSAVEFPEQTIVIAKDQPQYRPLPARIIDRQEGDVITCWQLSFLDRLTILFTGKLWCSVWTFCQPLQPLYFTVRKRDVIEQPVGETKQT